MKSSLAVMDCSVSSQWLYEFAHFMMVKELYTHTKPVNSKQKSVAVSMSISHYDSTMLCRANVVYWKREWQATSLFLAGETQNAMQKAKR